MSYDKILALLNDNLEKELSEIISREPKALYEPVKYTLDSGGKRIRPMLLLLSYSMFSNKIEDAIPAALAIEIFHNFTLLHYDIMDKAHVRRGKPCVHIAFSENSAILSGDAMSILSYEFLIRSKVVNQHALFSLFTQTALEICEGQQYDMDFETRNNVTVDEYLEMIRLKTAVLLGCSLKMGALLANENERAAQSLYEAGVNLGMAFQLRDDYLDTFGDEMVFGKVIGGDILNNKKTFLYLKALEVSNKEEHDQLVYWYRKTEFDKEEKITEVKDIFKKLKIDEIVMSKSQDYYAKAFNNLNLLVKYPEFLDELKTLADQLLFRKS